MSIHAQMTLIAMAAAISGCSLFVTNEAFGQSWKDHQVEQLKHQWGNPQAESSNTDGSSELRYELFNGGCTYWFTTDASGKIVSYRYKVNGWGTCKPIG